MQFQFNVAPMTTPVAPPPETPATPADLLRQILEVQREQLAQLRANTAAQEARWRAMLTRWKEDFPGLPEACKQILPALEKAFGGMLNNLADEIRQNDNDSLDNEFALQDFLDRYGMRLGQLGNILNFVTPLAEAAGQGETTS